MAVSDPKRPSMVEIISGPESRFDGFFRIDAYEVRYQKFNHGETVDVAPPVPVMSKPEKLLVFDRGHAVAALLYDPVLRLVIYVDQFRLPTYHKTKGADHRGTGWIYECAAGMIKEGENALGSLSREVAEETGYVIRDAIPIASYYSSPGGSTEMIHLYLAEVSTLDRKAKGRGVEDEDIDIVEMKVQDFFRRLDDRAFTDPKLILAGYFLKDHLSKSARMIELGSAPASRYRLKGSKDLIVGIRPGNMLNWHDIDVWVNSENTDMEMDQFHGRSVSATIRFAGAVKHEGTKRVKIDTIADDLKHKRGRQGYVAPATVIETTSGALEETNNVKRIFHVGVVEGAFGEGLSVTEEVLERSVDNVLASIDRANDRLRASEAYKSVLLPMMATGNAKFPLTSVAPRIVGRAVKYLDDKLKRENAGRGGGRLREIFLSAFDDRADMILRRILEEDHRLERL